MPNQIVEAVIRFKRRNISEMMNHATELMNQLKDSLAMATAAADELHRWNEQQKNPFAQRKRNDLRG